MPLVSILLRPRVYTKLETKVVSPILAQRALDLYVTSKIIEKEKYTVIQHFLELYLHPLVSNGNDNIKELYDKFAIIDKYGVFYPVLLQELYFMSLKVFGKPQSQQIIIEVSKLADHLNDVAHRQVRQDIRLDFEGNYCGFAIVIVGKAEKMSLAGTNPYVEYIKHRLIPMKEETIYLLGKAEHSGFVDDVAKDVYEYFEIYTSLKYRSVLQLGEGKVKQQDSYLVVLRSLDVAIYQN